MIRDSAFAGVLVVRCESVRQNAGFLEIFGKFRDRPFYGQGYVGFVRVGKRQIFVNFIRKRRSVGRQVYLAFFFSDRPDVFFKRNGFVEIRRLYEV